MSPSIKRFKVITTSCYCRYPFKGISSSQLDARFAPIAALFLKAITAQVPKDQWGVRIVSIGNRDVRRVRLLSNVSRALDEEGEIEVEVELISETICAGDECSESELSAAYQGGEEVLVGVAETADSGALIEAILVEAVTIGLDDVFADVVVGEVETDLPQTNVVQSTLSPSASPSSLSQTCEDSPLKFKLTTAGKSTYKKCEWVGRREDQKVQRCAIEGMSTHCPSTCGTCETCNDSTMRWNLPAELNKMKKRHCAWTARKNTATRCSIPGVSETCRLTCKFGDDCCIDDTDFTFPMISDPTKEQTCAWILKNNVETRKSNYCGNAGIAASCPESCGTCGCVNNPYFSFPMINDPTKEQTCAWILTNNVETRRSNYCGNAGIAASCPESCNTCGCVNNPYFSFPMINDPTKEQACAWILTNNVETRRSNYCEDAVIAASCAQACGTCCSDEPNFEFNFINNWSSSKGTCEWLTLNDKGDIRTSNYCGNGKKARFGCCGTCSSYGY